MLFYQGYLGDSLYESGIMAGVCVKDGGLLEFSQNHWKDLQKLWKGGMDVGLFYSCSKFIVISCQRTREIF